jgi:hypothetical protein
MSFATKVRYVGFCGADDSVDPGLLCILSHHYPWIEWGVLFRTDLEGTARYASPEWVSSLDHVIKNCSSTGTGQLPMNLAAHLCNDRCQQILSGDISFIQQLYSQGFRRVQVNATKANGVIVDPNSLSTYVRNIRYCMNEMKDIEWIFQLNTETQPIWDQLISELPCNVSVLYDASCGKGIQISEFPSPTQYSCCNAPVPCGYAGGIGPNSIQGVLSSLSSFIEPSILPKPVWIDMESSLRTIVLEGEEKKDIFDINKCMKCIRYAVEAGLPKV